MRKFLLNLSAIVVLILLSHTSFAAFQQVEVYEFFRGTDTQIAYATVNGTIAYELYASVYVDEFGNKGNGSATASLSVANEVIRSVSVSYRGTRSYNSSYTAYGVNTYKLYAYCTIYHKYMPAEGGYAEARVRVTW